MAKSIEDIVCEAYEIKGQIGGLLLKLDELEKEIHNHFDKEGTKEIITDLNDEGTKQLSCKKIERVLMTYDVDKLKKKLDDDVFIEATKRSYEISDINKMISLMKDAGVKAKDFKALIVAHITPDNQAIKRLYDAGEITMKQIEGAYTAKISKSIKYSEKVSD